MKYIVSGPVALVGVTGLDFVVLTFGQWIAFSVCSWCVVVLFQCLCSSYAGLLVCRILLGTFEGLFGTGIVYYLTLWYRRDEMGLRVFWFLGPTAIAGAFGGLISYGTGKIASDIPKWKILFLIEGLPGFCLGAFCLYWLPDRPLKNSRFSKDQQIIAKARYYHETFDKAGKISMKHIRWAFSDWKLYAQGRRGMAVYIIRNLTIRSYNICANRLSAIVN